MGKRNCCKLAFSNVVVRCWGREVFYSSLFRSQAFGELVPHTVNFTRASQCVCFSLLGGIGWLEGAGSCVFLFPLPMLELSIFL